MFNTEVYVCLAFLLFVRARECLHLGSVPCSVICSSSDNSWEWAKSHKDILQKCQCSDVLSRVSCSKDEYWNANLGTGACDACQTFCASVGTDECRNTCPRYSLDDTRPHIQDTNVTYRGSVILIKDDSPESEERAITVPLNIAPLVLVILVPVVVLVVIMVALWLWLISSDGILVLRISTYKTYVAGKQTKDVLRIQTV